MIYDPIIVMGPGRCGSSCLAGVLYYLGVSMAQCFEDFVPPDSDNPHGYWEDKKFLHLNESFRDNIEKWSLAAKARLNLRSTGGVRWGWKDPRRCERLQNYLPLLNKPIFVRVHRNPDDIEASMLKAYRKHGWTPERAKKIRTDRERHLDVGLVNQRVVHVLFTDLMQNKERTIRQLVESVELLAVTEAQITEAIDSIQKKPV